MASTHTHTKPTPCEEARNTVTALKVPISAGSRRPDAQASFFPADKIAQAFPKDVVRRVLECDCSDCRRDRDYFKRRPEEYLDAVVKYATSLFALLCHLKRPALVLGILRESFPRPSLGSSSAYTRRYLEGQCWKELCVRNKESARYLLDEFEGLKHNFFVEKIDGTYRNYDEQVILPFAGEEIVGKVREGGGQAQGHFGILYKFEIPEFYREFKMPKVFDKPFYVGHTINPQSILNPY
jgi:hypothetical protein